MWSRGMRGGAGFWVIVYTVVVIVALQVVVAAGVRGQDRPTLFGPSVALAGDRAVASWFGGRLETPIGAPGGLGLWAQVHAVPEVPLIETSVGFVAPEARAGHSTPYVAVGVSTLSVFQPRRAGGTGIAALGATLGVGVRMWLGSAAVVAGIRRATLLDQWTSLELAVVLAGG